MSDNKKQGKKKKNPNLRLIKNDDAVVKKDDEAVKSTKEEPVASNKTKKKPENKNANGKKNAGKPVKSKKKTGKKQPIKKAADKKAAGKKTTDKKIEDKKIENKKAGNKKIINNKSVDRKIVYDKTYKDKPEPGEWFVQHKSLILIAITVFVLVTVLAGVYTYLIKTYTVTTVYVDGNVHYTNEEVMNMVMTGRYGNNSLYLAAKYREKGVEGVPFVEKMDINILAPDTIRINVYEKALAGYVEYLGRYMYFDREGIVVESSEMKTAGIPQVTGLKFDYVVLNEPLPIENDEIFAKILSITQLLAKYELTADKIFFDSSFDLTLHFGGVKVTLGSSDEIDEKIMRLQYILPELEGKEGTLRMENYTEDTKNITFNQD